MKIATQWAYVGNERGKSLPFSPTFEAKMSKTLILHMVHVFCSNYLQGNKPETVNFGCLL